MLFDKDMSDASRNHWALVGAFLWILVTQGSGAEWYEVPSGGQVTFTLTQLWGVFKGQPPNSFIEGAATITLEYLDGSTEQIAFVDSDASVSTELGSPDGGPGLRLWYFRSAVWNKCVD
jgi:hypothetical protein